jgi:hypothetical protein
VWTFQALPLLAVGLLGALLLAPVSARAESVIRISANNPVRSLRQGELWSLTPSGRRIVVDVLMRRRGQTGRPRSARLSNVCLKKARRRAFR